jgi:hypothetical protein
MRRAAVPGEEIEETQHQLLVRLLSIPRIPSKKSVTQGEAGERAKTCLAGGNPELAHLPSQQPANDVLAHPRRHLDKRLPQRISEGCGERMKCEGRDSPL